MADDPRIELEIDSEWERVRRFRETQYVRAGIGEFVAFRLAMVPDIDWHKVVRQAEAGVTDDRLVDLYLD